MSNIDYDFSSLLADNGSSQSPKPQSDADLMAYLSTLKGSAPTANPVLSKAMPSAMPPSSPPLSNPPISATPSMSQPAPPIDMSKYMTNPDDIKAAIQQKADNSKWGRISDILSSQQSAGNFALGRLNPTADSSKYVEAQNESVDAPILAKQQALKNAISNQTLEKENLEYKKNQEAQRNYDDKDSTESVWAREQGKKLGFPIQGDETFNAINRAFGGKLEDVYKAKLMGDSRASLAGARFEHSDSNLTDKQDFSLHRDNLKQLNNNKMLNDSVKATQGLTVAMNMLQDPPEGKVTPELLQAAQQRARTSMAGAGNSSVGERAADYYHGVDQVFAKAIGMATSNPQDLGKNGGVYKYVVSEMNKENNNFQGMVSNDIAADMHGDYLYDKGSQYYNPKYDSDLKSAISKKMKQSGISTSPGDKTQSQPSKTITASPAELQAYAQKYKMTPAEAATTLQGQGVTLGQ